MTYSRRKKSRSKNRRKSLKRKTKKRKRSNRRRRRRGGGGDKGGDSAKILKWILEILPEILETKDIGHKLGKIWTQFYNAEGQWNFNLTNDFKEMNEQEKGNDLAKKMKNNLNNHPKFWKNLLEMFYKNPDLICNMLDPLGARAEKCKKQALRRRRRRLSHKGGGNGRITYQWMVMMIVAMVSSAFMSSISSFLRRTTGQDLPSSQDQTAAAEEFAERVLNQDYEGARSILDQWLPYLVVTGLVAGIFRLIISWMNRHGPGEAERRGRRRAQQDNSWQRILDGAAGDYN